MEQAPLAAVRKAQPPGPQTQLRAFLGLYNLYRTFSPRYSHIAAPLNALLQKGRTVKLEDFGNSENTAFETLKAMLTSSPLLPLPKLRL